MKIKRSSILWAALLFIFMSWFQLWSGTSLNLEYSIFEGKIALILLALWMCWDDKQD